MRNSLRWAEMNKNSVACDPFFTGHINNRNIELNLCIKNASQTYQLSINSAIDLLNQAKPVQQLELKKLTGLGKLQILTLTAR